MKKAIVALTILLLGSNAFWIYKLFEAGATASYRNRQIYELEETTKQLMNVLLKMAKSYTKKEIIKLAEKHSNEKAFDKDGCSWVGWIGLKFNKKGQLQSVSPSWSYKEKDPCYPALY